MTKLLQATIERVLADGCDLYLEEGRKAFLPRKEMWYPVNMTDSSRCHKRGDTITVFAVQRGKAQVLSQIAAKELTLKLWLYSQQLSGDYQPITARVFTKRLQIDPAAQGERHGSGPVEWYGDKPTREETIWVVLDSGPAAGYHGYVRRSQLVGESMQDKLRTFVSLKSGASVQLYLHNIVWKNEEPVIALTMSAPTALATPPCTEHAKSRLIRGLSIADNPSYACITASEEWGSGVFSWHCSYSDARYNARITGGVAVSVECYNFLLDQLFGFRRGCAKTTVD